MDHGENRIYAHTLSGRPSSDWETLDVHADRVAALACAMADEFGAGDWGALLGKWHDLGKASEAFQQYLQKSHDADAGEEDAPNKPSGRVDHSTFGARYARKMVPKLAGQLLAFCIAGHHAGLADAVATSGSSVRATLGHKLDASQYPIEPVTLSDDHRAAPPKLKLPFQPNTADPATAGFSIGFFARMLFSCLVDADRTATEAFCDKPQAAERAATAPALPQLCDALDRFLTRKQAEADPTPVNQIRAAVLKECLAASQSPRGFFSLNVPTGGGKTFASLAFALHHAAANPVLRRVVVAIPYTSIIEQTADQYRLALGELAAAGLVEHHSNLNPQKDTRQNKLASENWAAPLIVTTNVQLFESLFAAKGTPARKLHRLANSVIILDEAQMLPVDLLSPTLAALRELVAHYGCTVVLSTATQPALERHEKDFPVGIERPTPIVADAERLHGLLKRVTVERIRRIDDAALADRLAIESRVLCIVNTKGHAAKLFDELVARTGKDAGCFHLSTFMCPQHRRDALATIRQRLKDGLTCRVISTQLVEAGVDLDFPCVYRAEAGFDSIAQAAGRCNREGTLKDSFGRPALGRVYVFQSDIKPPPGVLLSGAEAAGELADRFPDPLHPEAVLAYFKLFYGGQKRSTLWDARGVLECFQFNREMQAHRDLVPLQFRAAAEAYRIIREEQTPVVVPYGPHGKGLIQRLKKGEPIDYDMYKQIQQYSVGVRDRTLQELHNNAAVVPHSDGVWFLLNRDGYSLEKGMLAKVVGIGAEEGVL